MLIIINLIQGYLYDHLMDTENTHFDKEQDTRTSSNHYKANGYMYDLDLLIILHSLHDAYPTPSGCTQTKVSNN